MQKHFVFIAAGMLGDKDNCIEKQHIRWYNAHMLYANLTLELQPRIESITENFRKQNGLSYFQYLRCYLDGSYSLLTNDTSLLEEFASQTNDTQLIYSSFAEEQASQFAYWFMWDEALPANPVQLAKQKLGIHNGVTLVRRSKNYYDMIAVALPKHIENAGTFYLNKKSAIEDFILNFDSSEKKLIAEINKKPVQLTVGRRDQNFNKIPLRSGGVELLINHQKVQLSCQELKALHYYTRGVSCKQIARIMWVSDRTVETYLQRIKIKCEFRSNLELLTICQ
ncbi:MAG: helix-turn-helix transcriptional regulator [Rickettsiales bacterium]